MKSNALKLTAIKKLREITQLGVLDCQKALEEANDDIEEALIILRKKGQSFQVDRSSRTSNNGEIHTFVHGGKIGVMVEVNCETDFLVKTTEWKIFIHDLAMQIAAMNPKYIDSNSVPENDLEKEKEIIIEQARSAGKPDDIIAKMVHGKLNKFYSQNCLVDQISIKDDKKTIQNMVNELEAQSGEKIIIKRFIRWKMGD